MLAAIGDGEVCTVNALSPEVYAGEGDFSYGRKGHITGSINLHYEDLLEDGCFKDGEALRQALDAKGLLAAPQVISYCGGGISATIDAFACLLCGKEEVAVYDGSMAEWVRDESLPMETGPVNGIRTTAHQFRRVEAMSYTHPEYLISPAELASRLGRQAHSGCDGTLRADRPTGPSAWSRGWRNSTRGTFSALCFWT